MDKHFKVRAVIIALGLSVLIRSESSLAQTSPKLTVELPRFCGQVRVLVVCCFLHAVLMILPDSESAAEGSRSAPILALA